MSKRVSNLDGDTRINGAKLLLNANIPRSQFSEAINFENIPRSQFSEAINFENIPRSQFREAINFEILHNDLHMQANHDDDDAASDATHEETGQDAGQTCTEETGQDTGQTCTEETGQDAGQTCLIERFQQFRLWQLKQQEQLMCEQQAQMAQLKAEQHQVQEMTIKQRTTHKTAIPNDRPDWTSKGGNNLKLADELDEGDWQRNESICSPSVADNLPTGNTSPEHWVHEQNVADESMDEQYVLNSPRKIDTAKHRHMKLVDATNSETGSYSPPYRTKLNKSGRLYSQARLIGGGTVKQLVARRPHQPACKQTSTTNLSVVDDPPKAPCVASKRTDTCNEIPAVTSDRLMRSDELSSLDEKPVRGLATSSKTFEQLVEETLRNEKHTSPVSQSTTNRKQPRVGGGAGCQRTFLKRGQGIARFGPPTKTKVAPKQKQQSATTTIHEWVPIGARNKPDDYCVALNQNVADVKVSSDLDRIRDDALQKVAVSLSPKATDSFIKKYEAEQDELDEFELLEQYADDNASFLSNMSTVNRVLQQKLTKSQYDKQKTEARLADKKDEIALHEGNGQNLNGLTDVAQEAGAVIRRKVLVKSDNTEPDCEPNKLISTDTCDTVCAAADMTIVDEESITDEEGKSLVFEDADTWDESIQHIDGVESEPIEVVDEMSGDMHAINIPQSKLITKLFPALKPQVTPPQVDKVVIPKQSNTSDGVMSKALREKLLQLEEEIARFRQENVTLEKLRTERQQALEHLQKEMAEFEKQKNEEMKRIHAYKADETAKLKREKKLFAQFQKTAKEMPDKKERDEIDRLKTQVGELQSEMKRKGDRWNASTIRLRDRVEQLDEENRELKNEIELADRRRLQASAQITKNKKCECVKLRDDTETKPEQPVNNSTADSNIQLESLADVDLETSREHIEPVEANGVTSSPERCVSSDEPAMVGVQQSTFRRKTAVESVVCNIDKGDNCYEETQHPDGKVERVYKNSAREIEFPNGTCKQISADGQSIIISFFNGDIKQLLPDQRLVYYYADTQTTHTTYPDGLEILKFANNQIEKHYPDGTREITFADQTVKYLFPNATEQSIFADGTIVKIDKNGNKTMQFVNGQREIHTTEFKKREYPDGTVKTVYPDGRQETRYSSGRLRIKDEKGNVLVDERA